MALRPCLDCGSLTSGSRCGSCRSARNRERDQQRGTRQQRGYDAAYDATHRDYQRRMDAGERFTCWRCAEAGKPHLVDPRPGRWHLGHDDHDRSVLRGPECPAGNLATTGRRRPGRVTRTGGQPRARGGPKKSGVSEGADPHHT